MKVNKQINSPRSRPPKRELVEAVSSPTRPLLLVRKRNEFNARGSGRAKRRRLIYYHRTRLLGDLAVAHRVFRQSNRKLTRFEA
jgi:hypothetical protein